MHIFRSKIRSRIKTLYKHQGESVKGGKPLLQVSNPSELRLEALVEIQYLGLVRERMTVVVEPTRFVRHERLLRGHLQNITGVTISKKLRVLSASNDKTVRVWDRAGAKEQMFFNHGTPVRAVACTPTDAQANLCLTVAAGGVGRL
jgi:WD40 repeat protein